MCLPCHANCLLRVGTPEVMLLDDVVADAIEALVGAPQTRDADGAVELPPPEFATTIGQLLEHWEVRSGIRAELRELIRIQGEVEENGQRRAFRRAADLEKVSSNGLSYLVLCSIFVAFINRIRQQAPVDVVWALDELKDLDAGNVAVRAGRHCCHPLFTALGLDAIIRASFYVYNTEDDVARLITGVEQARWRLTPRSFGSAAALWARRKTSGSSSPASDGS